MKLTWVSFIVVLGAILSYQQSQSPWLPVLIVLVASLYLLLQGCQSRQGLKKKRQAKIAAKSALIAEAMIGGPPSDFDQSIVTMSVADIMESARIGKFTVEDITRAFCKAAAVSDTELNCLTEIAFMEAIGHARQLDQRFAATGTPPGPLFGLVISVKDQVQLQGLDSTLGNIGSAGNPAQSDAHFVALLKEKGAVIHAKTAVPQTLLSFECRNPLFGVSLNPFHPDYTPGGSSGGEGALLARRGAMVGLGSDIGGSGRIPAHFSGCCGFKPTARLLPTREMRSGIPGQEGVAATLAPMGRCPEDIFFLTQHLLDDRIRQHDPFLIPFQLDEKEFQNDRPLRVGVFVDDGVCPATPACTRAVREVAAALEAQGHSVVPFSVPDGLEAMALFYSLMGADGGVTLERNVAGEPLEKSVKTLLRMARMPYFIKQALAAVLGRFKYTRKAAVLLAALKACSVSELWAIQFARTTYRRQFFDYWRTTGVDVVLCPPNALPAIRHGCFGDVSFAVSYTSLFNLLDMPAGVVPVTRTDPAIDQYPSGQPPSDLLEAKVRRAYEPLAAGLPIGVQLAALPFQDSTALRAMRIVANLKPFPA